MGKRLAAGAIAAAAAAGLLAAPAPSGAVVPGRDGLIAFGSETSPGGAIEIFTVRPDGTHLHQLTDTGGFNACASWSPDGSKIAFCSDRSGSFDLYIMSADGSHVRHIPTGLGYAVFPSWSPDGRRLSFVGSSGGGAAGDIYTIRLDGTGERNLTHDAADDGTQGANWSPSGDKIVFDSNAGGTYDVYTMNSDGTGVREITSGYGDDTAPDWSPDGRSIAFVHGGTDSAGNSIGEIYAVSSTGGPLHRLTTNTVTDDRNPAYSPDGRYVVFRRSRLSDGNTNLEILDTRTHAVRSLSTGALRHLAPDWQAARSS